MFTKRCADCGEEIESTRLKHFPEAMVCVDCQREREREGRYSKHVMEISQEIKGWTHEGVVTTIIRKQ